MQVNDMRGIYYDTLVPYAVIEHLGIQYTVCYDYNHISRNKGLRQVVHNPDNRDRRFMALETPNAFTTNATFNLYEVRAEEENRLDLIAYKLLGSAQYSWVIAYMNDIEDGFTCFEGQVLKIISNFTSLFEKGELLETINALSLNLGEE